MSLARKLSPGLLLAFGEYPDSWIIGGDDRDDAGLELDGWSYPRLESWPIPTQAVRTVSQASVVWDTPDDLRRKLAESIRANIIPKR